MDGMLLPVIVVCSIVSLSLSIPIDNAQIGDAEVDCKQNSIDIVFATEHEFEGRVFVVGHSNESSCSSSQTGSRTTSISIDLTKCGSLTTRSIDPPGLFISVKVLLSFHDKFVTKVDRGYEVQCFYMETDKTVTFPLSVSLNPFSPFSAQAEMPRCRYEVVDPQSKQPVEVAIVGQPVLHQWICESSSPDLWCMRVHSCYVGDDDGTEVNILDEEGCQIDRYLLSNLEYFPDGLHAQKEAHAFKFADRVVINFQCSVRLDTRDQGGECQVPECPDFARIKRGTGTLSSIKQLKREEEEGERTLDVDVRAKPIQVLDPIGDVHRVGHAMDSTPLSTRQCLLPAILTAALFVFGLAVALIYMIRMNNHKA